MKRFNVLLYLGLAGLTLAPVGWRVLSWRQGISHADDYAMAQAGKQLFTHEWQVNDPLSQGDGLGPAFNATSCAACHHQGGLGGAGGNEHNVTTFFNPRGPKSVQGVVHAFAVADEYQERLSHIDPSLPETVRPSLKQVNSGELLVQLCGPSIVLSQRNTTALFGVKQIDAIPDRVIIAHERQQRVKWNMASHTGHDAPVGRALRGTDGRVGKFGWRATAPTLAEFVQAACANELGLGNPGQAQPTPLGQPSYMPVGLDLTLQQCDQITAFLATLPRPVEIVADPRERDGKALFERVGCAECHVPSLGAVDGLYSDLLLHRMGGDLQGSGSYFPTPEAPLPPEHQPLSDEWRTPPLWGVADSAPYMHDGRAATLEDAIRLHGGGQGAHSLRQYSQLSTTQQQAIVAFLKTLRAP